MGVDGCVWEDEMPVFSGGQHQPDIRVNGRGFPEQGMQITNYPVFLNPCTQMSCWCRVQYRVNIDHKRYSSGSLSPYVEIARMRRTNPRRKKSMNEGGVSSRQFFISEML